MGVRNILFYIVNKTVENNKTHLKGVIMKRTNTFAILAIFSFALIATIITSCSRNSSNPTQPAIMGNLSSVQTPGQAPTLASQDLYQAYYDSMIFNITLVPMPGNADSSIFHHNSQINQIYMFEPNDSGFIFVIDAIPHDGMNPMWQEVEIHFNPGFTPRQFYSDDQVNEAAGGQTPEITLVPTNEIYRCSVVGHKPAMPPAGQQQ